MSLQETEVQRAYERKRQRFVQEYSTGTYNFLIDAKGFSEPEADLAADLVAHFTFGVDTVQRLALGKVNSQIRINLATNTYEPTEDIVDEDSTVSYFASNTEYSAVALESVLAHRYMVQYEEQLHAFYAKLTEFRRERRMQKLGVPEKVLGSAENIEIGMNEDGEFIINLAWLRELTDMILNHEDVPLEFSGIKYNNIFDLFLFAGYQEGAHKLKQEAEARNKKVIE